jgi:HSP20 family protein
MQQIKNLQTKKQITMTMLRLRPERNGIAVPRFSGLFDNFFENDFPAVFQSELSKLVSPSVNIKDTKDAYQIEVAAPGFAKENFSLKVEKDILTISGETKEDKLEEGGKFTRKEFSYAAFKRNFTLPETVVSEKIAAAYENGILKVTLPKAEEAKDKGPIEVKVA